MTPGVDALGTAHDTRQSRAEDVYGLLKQDIADFRLIPGDRFTETAICDRLGVSRTPVRQALYRLQQEGFVEVLFRAGWRVLPIDFQKFEQLYDLRKVLETEAVRRLCSEPHLLGESEYQSLADVWLQPADLRSHDAVAVGSLDEAFHCALVAATGNAEMARVHRDVTERIRIIRRLDFTWAARINATYDEHALILRAIRARRADEAVRLLGAHIDASQTEVRKITLHQIYMAQTASLQSPAAPR
ncbi:GntR family transcriptional regulator [Comamonadaceae bacterium PP-2]|nr:GntR family transcriptional regulator [Comamonas sp. BIGb0124]